ncbi:MAG: glycosyltransferase family 4 protein [Anaerolineae bacterium]|nr:glycosyltransferase family 4 protein [Anaerolineae bacterium]
MSGTSSASMINDQGTKSMRIGIDYTSAVRQRAGIGRYTRELVTALLTLDTSHHYTIFAATGGLPKDRWPSEMVRLSGIRHRHLSLRGVPVSDDWLARLWHRVRLPIPVELVTGHLDLFYSPDFTLPPTRDRVHTLLTVHDLSFMHHPDAFLPSLRRYLERVVPRSVKRADVVLADSAHTGSDLGTLFGVSSDKVEVITPGVDARFRPKAPADSADRRANVKRLRERYGIGDEPYVLSVGTLQPRKNYPRLIQAFARMKANRRGSGATKSAPRLLIAGGTGWLYDDIVSEADKHERVRLLGFVEDQDLPALYREASLFAFPSLYEGFGLPVLEAMACGVPVVCSNTSSLPEVAGDAALLVDPLDVDAMGAAMDLALEDDDLRNRMIDRGLAQAARFTWDRSAQQLFDVITSWEGR